MEAFSPWIRAFIYDFDDTIVESERINDELFSGLLRREFSVDLSRAEQDLLYGFSWSGVFQWLRENGGLRHGREEVWSRFTAIKQEYLRSHRLRTASGFDRMLELPAIHAIVSGSTRAELTTMMENAGLDPRRFQIVLSDDDIPRGKPEPDCYLEALRLLGIQAGQGLVFEDSAPGIEAAHRAGVPVAFVAELASRDNGAAADYRFPSFQHVHDWAQSRVQARVAGADPNEGTGKR